MSFRWPVDNVNVSQPFGADAAYYAKFNQSGHNGIDIAIPAKTPVYAADDGTVVFEGWGQNHPWALAPAGIWVLIDNVGSYSAYAHLDSTIVNKGQVVKKGQVIGYSGATGAATGPHLHFEMLPKNPNFKNGFAGRINPMPYIDARRGATADEVKQAYRDILERDADAGGLQTYTTNGMTIDEVRNDLANSPEKHQLDANKAAAAAAAAKTAADKKAAEEAAAKAAAAAEAAKQAALLKCQQYDELIKSNTSLITQFIDFLTKLLKISK